MQLNLPRNDHKMQANRSILSPQWPFQLNMELSMDNSRMEAPASLHLIAVLGDILARVQATHAKEEFGLWQIVASIKFVNHTIDAWVNSSQQQVPESSEVHVYESDFSEVSKSIDAILGEARLVRGTSKPSASPKGPLSTPRDAVTETPRKPKAADHKRNLERFSQALRMRPRKIVSSIEDAEHSSFSAAHEMLLKWMETKKDGWINTYAEQRCHNSTRRSPCFDDHQEKSFLEKSNATKKFLDSLWSIHSIPLDSVTKAEDDDAGGDLNEMGHENENSNATLTQSMQKSVEVLQAHCKRLNKRHLTAELLHVEGHFPCIISSVEEKQCRQDVGNHEEESVANDDCWLPAKVCWKVLDLQVKGIIMELETQAVPTFYSHLQQAVAMMQLMHSIHSNLFHCHLQSLLAQSFLLKSSAQRSRRVDDVLSSSSVYLCFRLAHYLVCNNGKALLSVARRVVIT